MIHEEIKILISAYLDGEVTPSEKTIVEEHLSTCTSCQKDYKQYMAMSSSLSKWSDETLSPDEEINVQKRFEQRREPMFTKRNLLAFGSTLALTIIVGSVVQKQMHSQLQARVQDASIYLTQGRLKSAADDMGDQYAASSASLRQNRAVLAYQPMFKSSALATTASEINKSSAQYEPYYASSNYDVNSTQVVNKRLGADLAVREATFSGNEAQSFDGSVPSLMNAVPEYKKSPDHKVIMNEDMTIKVQNAEKAQAELDGLVTKFNGIVLNFQINKYGDDSRRGMFVFKVLPKDLRNILREVRKLGEVQSENQSGQDITDQYDYLQARLDNYETVKGQLSKILAKNANNVDNNLNIQAQLAGVQANIDSLASSIKQYDDQSFMATVVINFYDISKPVVQPTIKPISFKDKFISTFKDNLKITVETAYVIGMNSFTGIVIALSFVFQILLWSLVIWGAYQLIKWMIKK